MLNLISVPYARHSTSRSSAPQTSTRTSTLDMLCSNRAPAGWPPLTRGSSIARSVDSAPVARIETNSDALRSLITDKYAWPLAASASNSVTRDIVFLEFLDRFNHVFTAPKIAFAASYAGHSSDPQPINAKPMDRQPRSSARSSAIWTASSILTNFFSPLNWGTSTWATALMLPLEASAPDPVTIACPIPGLAVLATCMVSSI
mmetsp:Transcript_47713/g.126523  ORF Transcript_47713/g.126523 Transcript_47713/m.126523 type:complete len:203 (+) Transcript_47713:495-1103(+)